MTAGQAGAPRANRQGDPCPRWCAVDHADISAHISDPMTVGRLPWDAHVKLVQGSGERRTHIDITKIAAGFQFHAAHAADLAGLLEALADEPPGRLRELAGEVRAAASILADPGDAQSPAN